MPTWGEILQEIRDLNKNGDPQALDKVRNKYVSDLSVHTGRNVIVYASRWTQGDAPPNIISINDEDIQAFMEAIAGLEGTELDLLLHTGGGSAEATDGIVSYLRKK